MVPTDFDSLRNYYHEVYPELIEQLEKLQQTPSKT